MIFGQPSSFAIRAEVDEMPAMGSPEDHRAWERFVFGRFAFVIGGEVVGDFDLGCSLRVASSECSAVLKRAGAWSVSATRFNGTARSAFDEIYRALVGDDSQTGEEADAAWQRAHAHSITHQVDVFDGWMVYVMEHGDRARVLWAQHAIPAVHECLLGAGEVDRVLREFVAWFEPEFPFPPGEEDDD